MKSLIQLLAVCFVGALLVSRPASAATIGTFTGGDPGEGLDLQGNFTYAVNVGPSGAAGKAGDANFTADNSAGVQITTTHNIATGGWNLAEYGDTANDNNLEFVMKSIRWSQAPATVVLKVKVEKNADYKLQLLFAEHCCPGRGFNVVIAGKTELTNFMPGPTQAGNEVFNDVRTQLGVVVTQELKAATDELEIVLDGPAADLAEINDHNAILNGFTLERISVVTDNDKDGLRDDWESRFFVNLDQGANDDSDKDGLTNLVEQSLGTDPTKLDSDGDGLSDGDEVNKYKTDPLKSGDADGDLLSDGAEVNQYKTDPSKADTDGDGFSDYNEIHLLTDPVSPNSKPKKTTANLFTGPSPGQGLDFSGTFPYAISFGNDQPGGQIGNALFTSDAVDGFAVVSSQVANNWNVDVDYGSSAEQQVLSSVLASIRWSGSANTPADVTATFANLKIGASYKMQLLFGERLWARGFNISINGKLVASEFAPYQWQGGFVGPGNATPRTNGVVVTHSFIATSTAAVVVLDGRPVRDPAMADHNAIINGATLELISPAVDSDGDTLWDAWEMESFGNLSQNATGDADSDGLTNLQEFTADTHPNNSDSDGDVLNDGDEVKTYKTDPSKADTDGDRLSDGDEVKIYKSDPTKTDTDGDTLSDGDEVLTYKTDPIKANVTTLFAIDDKQVWKYDRSGTDLGTAWKEKSFNDNAWPSGMALIAQEPGATAEPIRTEIERFNDAGDYIVTFYYRTHFNYTGPPGGFLLLRHVVDDGAVFYLNGVEIHRFGLAAGAALNFTTSFAGHENAYEGPFIIPGTNLVSGDNVFAVEVHQSGTGSSDIVFGAELRVSTSPAAPPTTAPKFTVFNRAGTNLNLEWTGTGTLESADAVTGPWTAVANAKSPFSAALAGTIKFYRLK